jgi:hypothetical protein
MVQKGGPIIMMQIENEYGSYGDVSTNEADEEYMLALIDLARRHMGDELILYTTDFGDLEHMQKGSFEGDIVYTVGYRDAASQLSTLTAHHVMLPETSHQKKITTPASRHKSR